MSDEFAEPGEPTEVRGTPAEPPSVPAEPPIDLTDATPATPMPTSTPEQTPTGPSPTDVLRDDPLAALPLVLAVAAALMLLGAILFALATASSSTSVGSNVRFRLLGAAAHPVTALTALGAMVLLVEDRARRTERVLLAPVASGIATAVSLSVVLLGINGILTDLTGDASALFRISSLTTRLAPIGLAAVALWLSLRATPTARARRRTPTAGGG